MANYYQTLAKYVAITTAALCLQGCASFDPYRDNLSEYRDKDGRSIGKMIQDIPVTIDVLGFKDGEWKLLPQLHTLEEKLDFKFITK